MSKGKITDNLAEVRKRMGTDLPVELKKVKVVKNTTQGLYGKDRKLFSTEVTKYDLKPRQLLALKDYVNNGGNVSKACSVAGVQRRTWYAWAYMDNPFRIARDLASEEVKRRRMIDDNDDVLDVEAALIKNAKGGKENSIMFYLKNRAPERYQNDYVHGQQYIKNQQNTVNFIGDFKELSNTELLDKIKDMAGAITKEEVIDIKPVDDTEKE